MKIDVNHVVTLHYTLKNNATLEQIEKTSPEQPMEFLYGIERILPKFEEEIHGLEVGNSFSMVIPVADAYGEKEDANIAQIPNEVFHDEQGNMDTEFIQVGAKVPMSDSEGNQMVGHVLQMTDVFIEMDFNHPLAGIELHFEGMIEAVRAATTEEISHGHSHGAHGHQH